MGWRTIELDPSWPRVNEGSGVHVPITGPARVRCNKEENGPMGLLAPAWATEVADLSHVEL